MLPPRVPMNYLKKCQPIGQLQLTYIHTYIYICQDNTEDPCQDNTRNQCQDNTRDQCQDITRDRFQDNTIDQYQCQMCYQYTKNTLLSLSGEIIKQVVLRPKKFSLMKQIE